ncbi:MAG: hypothetical protein IPK82_40860 [Polyangiaceae bacterium]|nr:hypothetical protein [Polyangiaceae bacterium]
MSKKTISYKWVLIGAEVIFFLNLLMQALLANPVKSQLINAFPGAAGPLIFVGIIAFGAFFIGGALIGLGSPGETIKEPAIAAAIAAGRFALLGFQAVDGKNITVLDWLIGALITTSVGFVMALGGAWVGEKLQGDTEEKHRESHEPPPPAET